MGGTMRLGVNASRLVEGTRSQACYGTVEIEERHRHRYEFNPDYRSQFEDAGMRIAGTTPDGLLAEVIEIADHPWFVSVQFHPEFTSRFMRAQPLFIGFVRACLERSDSAPSS